MPHGAGGGSHFGGHTGGNHGGGFHGGGSSSNGPRISYFNYPGAKRYVYYYKRRPYVYYGDAVASGINDLRFSGIFIMIFGLLVNLVLLLVSPIPKSEYKLTTKLSRNYNDEIIIEDNLGIITDKEELEESLEKFLKKTGICICVVTYTKEEGRNINGSRELKRRTLREYSRRWEDERHYLIYYEGDELDRSDNWFYYVVCGDECVSIIDYDGEEELVEDLYYYLRDSENYTFEEAITEAVKNLKPNLKGGFIYKLGAEHYGKKVGGTRVKLMDFMWNESSFVVYIGAAVLVIWGFVWFMMSFKNKEEDEKRKARAKAIELMDATSELFEEACRNCGGIYYRGTVKKCPYCRLPIDSMDGGENMETESPERRGTRTKGSELLAMEGSTEEQRRASNGGSIEEFFNQLYKGEVISNENMQALVDKMNEDETVIYHPYQEFKDVLSKTNEYLNYKGSFRYYSRRGNVETVTPATFREFINEWFAIPEVPSWNPDVLYNEIIEAGKKKNFRQAEQLGFFAENQKGEVKPVTAREIIDEYFNDMIRDESRYMILTSPRPQFGVKAVKAERHGDQIEIQILIKEKNKFYKMRTDGTSAKKIFMDFFYGRFVPDMRGYEAVDPDPVNPSDQGKNDFWSNSQNDYAESGIKRERYKLEISNKAEHRDV